MIPDSTLRYDTEIQKIIASFKWSTSHLPIRYLGDEALRTKCTPVGVDDFNSDELRRMISNMTEVLKVYRKKYGIGRGLAANQIGYGKRVVVLWLNDGPLELINPEVISEKGKASYWEMCLSSGMLIGEVHRPWLCTFKYQNMQGETHKLEADEMQTRVLLHELDHLNAVSCTDRYEPLTMRFIRQIKTEVLGSPLRVLSKR